MAQKKSSGSKVVKKATKKAVKKAAKKNPGLFFGLLFAFMLVGVVVIVLWYTGIIKLPNKEADSSIETSEIVESSTIEEKFITINVDGNTVTIKRESDGSFKYTIPEKEGYTFAGYYSDSEFKNELNNEALKEATNVYIKYEKNIVVYDVNIYDGDTLVETLKVNENTVVSYTAKAKDDYNFIGIYTDKELTKKYENDEINSNTNLYLKYEAKAPDAIEYDVKIYEGDTLITTVKVTENTDLTYSAPTKDHYTFAGLYLDKDLNTKYNNENITGNTDLYLSYTINKYTVSFMVDGKVYKRPSVEALKTVEAPANPSKDGYTFVGWYSDKELTKEFDFNKAIEANTIAYAKFELLAAPISFNFLELGNQYAGDSTYIKAGDIDIIIDAGSRNGSATTIESYVDKYCTDGKIEYVIATHGHQDHIAGMVGNYTTTAGKYKNVKGEAITTSNAGNNKSYNGILYYYEIGTIIDYTYTGSTSTVAKEYEYAVDYAVSKGATHYDANELFGDTKKHSNVFEIATGITMEVLYQKFYDTKASDENDNSVVTMFNASNEHFLLTGDLEKDGEESLVASNPTLPKCKLFKGGHHGSKTSSNECLLKLIQPETVCVCCCSGSDEYTGITDNQFPTQAFIDRVAIYTDAIYCTTQAKYEVAQATANAKGESNIVGVAVGKDYLKTTGFESMNGNIVCKYEANVFTVNCSNNNTKLKDSAWFNAEITLNGVTRKMRTWPANGK